MAEHRRATANAAFRPNPGMARSVPSTAPTGSEDLYVQQSPGFSSPSTYKRRIATLPDFAAWSLQADPGPVLQNMLYFLRKYGRNLFRLHSRETSGSTGLTMHPGQLQRSTGLGISWADVGPSPVEDGANATWGINEIDISPNGTLWACTCCSDPTNAVVPPPHVYKSTDGGETWQQVFQETQGAGFRFIDITVHPTNPSLIAVIGDLIPGIVKTWITTDGGANWTRNSGSAGQSVMGGRRMLMLSTGRLIQEMGSTACSFLYSDDFGVSWNYSADSFSLVYYDMIRTPNDILFAAGGAASVPRVKRSLDFGVTWPDILVDTPSILTRYGSLAYSSVTGALYIGAFLDAGTTGRVQRIADPLGAATDLTDLTLNLDSLFPELDAYIGVMGLVLDEQSPQVASFGTGNAKRQPIPQQGYARRNT